MTARVTTEDLLAGADWLRAYEAEWGPIGDNGAPEDDERAQAHLRVADWLDAEIARRTRAQAVRAIAKTHGVSTTTARRALKRAEEEAP